jgi:fucose permease
VKSEYRGALQSSGPRKALAGFFLSGGAVTLPGALFPAWGYHLSADLGLLGTYFVLLGTGLLAGIWPSVLIWRRLGLDGSLMLGCAWLAASLGFLAEGPAAHAARLLGMAWAGSAAALLNTAVFRGMAPLYRHNPGATLNLAALFFGTGAVVTSLLFAVGFEAGPRVLLWMLAVAALMLIPFFRGAEVERRSLGGPLAYVLDEARSPGAVLLGVAVFFQFGNEWAMSGWLGMFIVQRLGRSPAAGLLFVALFWGLLMCGRVLAQRVLRRMSNGAALGWMLGFGLLGVLLLGSTDNRFGAIWGTAMLAGSFALGLPLVARQTSKRLHRYHPDFFHGIFALAAIGGLFAPATLGWIASWWGIRTLMVIPFLGSLAVAAVVGLLVLEREMEPVIELKSGR